MKDNIVVELRAGEGGLDASLLVVDMANIYKKACQLNNFQFEIIEQRKGFIKLWIEGENVKQFFNNEIGGHRWQRVPPTESKGRIQTSTVTVSVLSKCDYKQIKLYPGEVKKNYTRGSGPGGQHKNKTESCVLLTHLSTGITARCDGRNQHQNEKEAWKILTERVNHFYKTGKIEEIVEIRKKQIGSGMRGDKRRTYREKNNMVIDHVNNKKGTLSQILRGELNILHK